MSLSIQRQRRIVTLIRWVMFIALAYLTTAGDASAVQLGLLAVVAASNIALTRISDTHWEHQALLPVIAGVDTIVLVGAMWAGQGFARDFFFAYFAHLAVVALAGNLRSAIVGTATVVSAYGGYLALEHGVSFLQTPELIGRLGFLFSVGVGYGGLLDASRIRIREAALQAQLVGWVGKLSAAFSDDFDVVEVIRQVLRETQDAFPGNARASLVQIEGNSVRVIGSSDDDKGEFELTPERYPELIAVVKSGETLVIDDLRTDPVTESVSEFVADLPFDALLLCPVDLEDSEFGHVILRIARKGPSFSPSVINTAEYVAQAIGIIFRQAKMREAMERSEKMEMVSQVTSSVAHSFNGILSTVLLQSQGLRKGANQHDTMVDCGIPPCGTGAAARFDAIERATKEGLTIVERLGAWTRVGSGEGEQLASNVLVPKSLFQEAWRFASSVWAKRSQTRALELQWDCPRPVPAVIGSSAELREVLLNLMLNAIDAMPKGGVMTLGLHAEEDTVVFSVRDNGTGIAPDIVGQIFNPLFTTKGSAGTGLGLSLARSVAERHGGSLQVETTERAGSCFTLRIPATAEVPVTVADPEVENGADAGSPTAGARLLLVDPSELVRDVMVRALQGSGYEVDVVADLDEAEVMLGARRGYNGLIADAAADRPRAEGFLQHLGSQHPELEGRVVFYANGQLPPAMLELQRTHGFACFDRSAGLAGLRDALAHLGEARDAA
jgi:signal transduction histidine kinase